MSHFRTNGPLWLTIGGDKRRCTLLDLIMPIVGRSQLVSDCVMALSAGDLSKYEPTSSEMSHLADSFYGQAVAGVRSALDRELVPSDAAQSIVGAGECRCLSQSAFN